MGVTRYAGHTAGANDTLSPYGAREWNWEGESINLSKNVSASCCLPGMPTTGTDGYGIEVITDQDAWVETRSFTSHNLEHGQVEEVLQYGKKRNSVITLTTVTGFTFTGRFISFSATLNEGSAFYDGTITLRATSNEKSGTPSQTHTLADGRT